MNRYIDLEELERRIKENVPTSGGGNTPYEVDLLDWCKDECIRQAYAMPWGDVVEVRHGHWGFDGTGWTCSECDNYALFDILSEYCPQCGAKMDGERREQNEG